VPAVVLHGHPRAEPGLPEAARLDEAHHPLTVAAPRLQQLEHAVVVDRVTGERPSHGVVHVEVADAHGVRVAVRALRGLGRRPDADARDRAEPSRDLVAPPPERQRALEARRRGRDGDEGARALGIDARAVPLP
jgi:hypothetical protein